MKCPAQFQDFLSHTSSELDEMFGSRVEEIEQKFHREAKSKRPQGNVTTWGAFLHNGNQTWVGLDTDTLQTPYSELVEMLIHLKLTSQSRVVDLGAGYGRMGIVLGHLFPDVSFIGYEYLSERVAEGNRIFEEWEVTNAKLIQEDLSSERFVLPESDVYFVYDYGQVQHLRHTLRQIEKMADQRSFKVIARGKGVRSLIDHEHPWLSQIYEPFRTDNFTIYSMSL